MKKNKERCSTAVDDCLGAVLQAASVLVVVSTEKNLATNSQFDDLFFAKT